MATTGIFTFNYSENLYPLRFLLRGHKMSQLPGPPPEHDVPYGRPLKLGWSEFNVGALRQLPGD